MRYAPEQQIRQWFKIVFTDEELKNIKKHLDSIELIGNRYNDALVRLINND